MRNLVLAAAAAAVAVPATFVVPTDSVQAQRRYSNSGYYNGPVWRDRQGRYRCRRSNGTTGLIVGAVAGALVGREVQRSSARRRCR